MNAFVNALRNTPALTMNGAVTNQTTGNPVLDLFNVAGNRDVDLSQDFELARAYDSKLAYRVALWTRDIRGGAGERSTFRKLTKYLEQNHTDDLLKLLPKIPEVGRWDDLLIFDNMAVKLEAYAVIKKALLEDKNGLAAKWMPRKGPIAAELANYMDLSPKKYRKLLVGLTKVVESQMCAKNWTEINFSHVPSVASARYQKAFGRNAKEQYSAYIAGLTKVKEDGTTETKVNAGAVYPYDVIKSLKNGSEKVAEAQWDALPNFLGENSIIPMVDVSGSMGAWSYYGQRNKPVTNITPMDISLSIGLYCADKQKGAFSNAILTFNSDSKLQVLTGSLRTKFNQLAQSDKAWGNTNVAKGFEEILRVAVANKVPQSDMPKILLIISDMEFDASVTSENRSVTAFDYARQAFAQAGYTLPKVVFWSVNGRSGNNPVTKHDTGAALVSGFSPAILKSILSDNLDGFTPEAVMLETLKNPKYDVPRLTV